MASCRKIQGVLAESLYEDIDAGDRTKLDDHLVKCPSCRQQAEELKALVSSVPVTKVELDEDLVPRVRARLDSEPSRALAFRLHPALRYAGAALVLAAVAGLVFLQSGRPGDSNQGRGRTPGDSKFFAAVDVLEAENNYSAAYMQLAELRTPELDARVAGEVTLRQARLAFYELHWYPEAYAHYETLRQEHGEIFRADTENIERLNLLDEARGPAGDFAPLHAFDAADRSGSFEQFELLVGRRPGTYLASLATTEMAALAAQDLELSGAGSELVAMEAALDQCTNPIAIAQIKIEIGRVLSEGDDPERARRFYEEVVESGNTVLAAVARDALERMGHEDRN